MDEERGASRAPGLSDRGGGDVEGASQLQGAEIDREWAGRRIEMYRGMDAAIQQTIANILNSAAETRAAMEDEAKAILDRMRHERSRLVEDIRDYRRQRDGLAAEVADTRRRADEEATRIRRAAETERAQMLRESETRKAELTTEIQRLEQQLNDVSSGIQSLLQEPPTRTRGDLGPLLRGRAAEAGGRPTAAAEPRAQRVEPARPTLSPEPGAPPPALAASAYAQVAAQPIATTSPGSSSPLAEGEGVAQVASPSPSLSGRGETAGPASPRAESTTAGAIPRPTAMAPPRPPPVRSTPRPTPEPAPVAAPRPPATSAPTPEGRVEVAIANTPSFARALELQRGIQRTDGVRQVQALQFERGTLVLSIEHEAGLDLAAALIALPGTSLELTSQAPGRLELAFTG